MEVSELERKFYDEVYRPQTEGSIGNPLFKQAFAEYVAGTFDPKVCKERLREQRQWIKFSPMGSTASGKTQIWLVQTVENPTALGMVRWFGRWRCYAFHPHTGTLYEQDCLRAIADFCEEQTELHKVALK